MTDILIMIGLVCALCCSLYCSWYFIRQGGVKKTIIGILLFFVVGFIPFAPFVVAMGLFLHQKKIQQKHQIKGCELIEL